MYAVSVTSASGSEVEGLVTLPSFDITLSSEECHEITVLFLPLTGRYKSSVTASRLPSMLSSA